MVSEGSGRRSSRQRTRVRLRSPWPARGAAYYGLTVIIFATALNFMDAQIFTMLAQRIKADFQLTDEQLGFLLGPANIISTCWSGSRWRAWWTSTRASTCSPVASSSSAALPPLADSRRTSYTVHEPHAGRRGRLGTPPGSYSMLADYFPPRNCRGPSASCNLASSAAMYSASTSVGCCSPSWRRGRILLGWA